jgi:hypothetical protein
MRRVISVLYPLNHQEKTLKLFCFTFFYIVKHSFLCFFAVFDVFLCFLIRKTCICHFYLFNFMS